MMNTQGTNVGNITNKWVLAQCLSGNSKAPRQALESIFTGVMQQLELVSKTSFAPEMKERVWAAVSKEKLTTLQNTLKTEFCNKILGGFSEKEAQDMAEEHKQHGAVINQAYSWRLQIAYSLYREEVNNSILKEASSMTDSWLVEIVEAVKKEGVKLPELKSNTP